MRLCCTKGILQLLGLINMLIIYSPLFNTSATICLQSQIWVIYLFIIIILMGRIWANRQSTTMIISIVLVLLQDGIKVWWWGICYKLYHWLRYNLSIDELVLWIKVIGPSLFIKIYFTDSPLWREILNNVIFFNQDVLQLLVIGQAACKKGK